MPYAAKTDGLDTWSRTWARSPKRPYVNPLPYQFNWRRESQYPGVSPGNQVNDYAWGLTNPMPHELASLAYRARIQWAERAKGGLGADLGLTLATWKSSLSMVTGAFKALANKAERAELYYRRKSSSLYLEGIFGWVPLIQDIHNAYQVLSDLSPTARLQKVRPQETFSLSGDLGGNTRGTLQTSFGVQVGGRIRATNPNLALLERLGLVNPAAVAWDAVPYSFVVNWFIPVGTFLKSLSDMVGWEAQSPWTTYYIRKTYVGEILAQDPSAGGEYRWLPRRVESGLVRREPGLPPIVLPTFNLPTGDLYKATVALALLDQKLRYPLQNAWRNRNRYTE